MNIQQKSARDLPLNLSQAAWGESCTLLFQSLDCDFAKTLNLYKQFLLKNDADWCRQQFGHVAGIYFTNNKPIFNYISKN